MLSLGGPKLKKKLEGQEMCALLFFTIPKHDPNRRPSDSIPLYRCAAFDLTQSLNPVRNPALYILIGHVSWNYWIGTIKHYYRATSNNELKALCSGSQLLLRRPQNQIHQHFQVKFFVFKFGGIRWPLFYRQHFTVLSIGLSSHPYLLRCTA